MLLIIYKKIDLFDGFSYLYENKNKDTLTGMLWRGIDINEVVDKVINNIRTVINDYIRLVNENSEMYDDIENNLVDIDVEFFKNVFIGFNCEYFLEDFYDELDSYLEEVKNRLIRKYSNYLK